MADVLIGTRCVAIKGNAEPLNSDALNLAGSLL